jgi:hypothetical protein
LAAQVRKKWKVTQEGVFLPESLFRTATVVIVGDSQQDTGVFSPQSFSLGRL